MAAFDKLIKQLFNEHLNALHTSMPCTVVKVWPDGTVDLQPEFKRKKGGATMDYPIIRKVPKLGHVGALLPGTKVYVSFAERALDHIGTRRHDITDAVIIGVM